MKKGGKAVIAAAILVFLAQLCIPAGIFAANDAPTVPGDLRVNPLHNTPPGDVQPAIGYNETDGSYIDLTWTAATAPAGASGVQGMYYNIYLQEIGKYGTPSSNPVLRERDVVSTSRRLSGLKSGTVYCIYVKAYYKYTDGTSSYSSPESGPSNTLKVLTDITIAAYSYSTNQVKIEWDDAWNTGSRRIDCKLYISDSSDFSNTQPIFINQSIIDPNGPVKINQTTGKLEYIHTVRDPSRICYIKIVPDIPDSDLKKSAESAVVVASSRILVKTVKMSTIDTGTVWRLDWSPVVTGLSGNDINVSYIIYKGVVGSSALPVNMAEVGDTSFFLTIPFGEDNTYYIISARITRNGVDVYRMKIESDQIIMKEQDIPSNPPAPEIVGEFKDSSGNTVISYGSRLSPNSATILWRVPRKSDGTVDTDISYDIWLVSDPALIDNPPDNMKIAASLKMDTDNYRVMSGIALLGYKYDLTGLTANSTYYVKITANKTFVGTVDGRLGNVKYSSQPALKAVTTPAGAPADQPQVPSRPPLAVKKSPPPESKNMITDTTAVIQLKNKWYERYNNSSGKWEYVKTEKNTENDTVDYNPTANPPDNKQYRSVEYDQGITLNVGCVKYVEGMTYSDIATMPTEKVVGFPSAANDPAENPLLNPDRTKHNISIPITNLEPNTTYIIWVRAVRSGTSLISGPSDPLVITTNPTVTAPVEKPVPPSFSYMLPADTFVDLGWGIGPGYSYNIKYGTADNINTASGSRNVNAQELTDRGYCRIAGLNPDTEYYFWIQAQSTDSTGKTNQSGWSDSYAVKTLPCIAPTAPKGFGIKDAADAVTGNTITFEWLKADDIEYMLELSDNSGYKDARVINAGKTSEYTASGLRANCRYYARLYAFNPVSRLKSDPTPGITVKTERSGDDYDSNQNTDSPITGDIIDRDPAVVKNAWSARITGVNADRLVERIMTGDGADYRVDLSKTPSKADKITVTVSNSVFAALSQLKRNLILETGDVRLTITPGMLGGTPGKKQDKRLENMNYVISVSLSDKSPGPNEKNIIFRTRIAEIGVNGQDGSSTVPVGRFSKPMKVELTYDPGNANSREATSAIVYDAGSMHWKKVDAENSVDSQTGIGYLSFEAVQPLKAAAAIFTGGYYDDMDKLDDTSEIKTAVNSIALIHNLKSVPGNKFDPDANMTVGDAVKLVLDILDCSYDDNFMTVAAKAGLTGIEDINGAALMCTREKAVAMAVRLYEMKSGRRAAPVNNAAVFSDVGKVTPAFLPYVSFAAGNGIVAEGWGKKLDPKTPVERGEMIVLLAKSLALAGEIGQ